MKIFPAIDLFDGKAVRLYKGDYAQMTIYSDNPVEIALDFVNAGAKYMHLVDLEGAKSGGTPNVETIKNIVNATNLFVEVGGGIRSLEVIKTYIDAGVSRVILGT
ncbi:MAG: 1-(5-phosphoribosyl)-5-((5-phosphoribosylamino)methylideneamino)imidazole-4-carboxamide isomerase, partial [Clostridia bacterium]|nr:1-(5-phosphoribosyl)-5-((5-phosphoribosylamino)methylideneamino)imidazole-4-carboxamide isomerase [Clostridia bacterium]